MGRRLDTATALYLEAIRDGDAESAIARHAGERYTQHSTPVQDGPAGFVEFFDDFHKRNPVRDVEIIRGFEDGSYVFLHVAQNLNDGEFRYVTADIFDTDDDAKLIEHWDMIEEIRPTIESGHTQIDGPTEATDLHKTEQNKQLVRNYAHDVLMNGDIEALSDFVSTTSYVEHAPTGRDGFDALNERLRATHASDRDFAYTEVHNVIGRGNIVATLAQAVRSGVDTAIIDLFRVDARRIVEHWEVSESITPADTWVNSGKF